MKSLFKLFSAMAVIVAIGGCKMQNGEKKGGGISRANLDTTVSPSKDFFQYANGGWLKENPIPSDQVRWGSFSILAENNKKNLKELAEAAASKSGVARGTAEQLAGDFFHSAMDTVNIEKLKASPIEGEMAAIDKIG